MLDQVVRHYRNWKQYRSTYDELSRMSNRELADIGISRCDIARYARMAAK
ncbi:DUF1127 domain-containing protein [Roseibium aggregatum]|uniref:DUF1127 domain-containing protein n=1 Tax=Roseibium aggregatum TaxID=187304 RepID=A0A926NZS6_9HYPH|nr:DUF1127 domain-containing protein [Roseibium aggregatum]MBD1546313.1 DUF1127 domain-containing protein [Roseibium aggregatum]